MSKKSLKGGQFERTVCKELSLWWTGNEHDDIFWRSSQSGGRATQRAKFGKRTINNSGDIAPTDSSGEPLTNYILFECKTGYKHKVDALKYIDSDGNVNELHEWWRKASQERGQADKVESMLIIKRYSKQVICVISLKFMGLLENYNGLYPHSIINIKSGLQEIVCVNYIQFFKWLSPETMKMISEGNNAENINRHGKKNTSSGNGKNFIKRCKHNKFLKK